MSRQIILHSITYTYYILHITYYIVLKTVHEALGKEKNNQTKQNILGCSVTSLKNTTGNLSTFSG